MPEIKKLPLLRVEVNAEGVVERFSAEPSEWWDAVLAGDERSSQRDDHWLARSPKLRGHILIVNCGKCSHQSEHDGTELAEANEADVPIASIAAKLTQCRHRMKSCQFSWHLWPIRKRK